jgi:hypothetical protein
MATENSGEFEGFLESSEINRDFSGSLQGEMSELLEAVLKETTEEGNTESLQLLVRVARRSEFDSPDHPAAMQQVVRAIVDQRFGIGKFSNNLVRRIASSLLEIPEATRRLCKLWQEARQS